MLDEHDALALAAIALAGQATHTLALAVSALVKRRTAGTETDPEPTDAVNEPPEDHGTVST